jgi:hypothetical protein
LNLLESIDTESYTSIEQYRADIASPQAKAPAIRQAYERKLERSWPLLRSQSTHTHTTSGKRQFFVRAHIDANGQSQTKVSGSYMPEVTAEQVELQEKGSVRVVAGGVLRLNVGTKGRR